MTGNGMLSLHNLIFNLPYVIEQHLVVCH